MEIRQAEAGDIPAARALMREYQAELGEDLCFQGFDAELAGLPGLYQPPMGALLLLWEDGSPVGCGAFRPFASEDGICEMKRLYLQPAYRGGGRGVRLVSELMALASKAGYRRIRLDTLPAMQAAKALYHRLGFVDIGAYYNNPLPGVTYLEAELGR
jgi:putative acetyltransferase